MIEVIQFGPSRGQNAAPKSPAVTIGRAGTVTLNKQAMELIGLKKGDQVLICQGVKNKNNWYIKKTDKDGFILRKTYKAVDDGYGLFMCKSITEKIMISLNIAKTTRIPIIEKVMEGDLWALDVASF